MAKKKCHCLAVNVLPLVMRRVQIHHEQMSHVRHAKKPPFRGMEIRVNSETAIRKMDASSSGEAGGLCYGRLPEAQKLRGLGKKNATKSATTTRLVEEARIRCQKK